MSGSDKKIWDHMSSIYDTFMKKDKNLYEEITLGITKDVDPKGKILEIGTATGNIALLLANKIDQVEAIDYSEKMIKIARKKANELNIDNVHFELGNAYELDYDDNTFDNIVIANVLHIMPEPENAIEEIKRVMKKDGKLFAPTFTHKYSKKGQILEKFGAIVGFKTYSTWSPETYEEFLEAMGLKVIHSHTMNLSFILDYVVCKIA